MRLEKISYEESIGFSTRLIYELLGSEIIESNSISFAEQIKNARDANATNVTIDLSKLDEDIVIIQDNGDGMSLEEIRKNWLMVGTNNKTTDKKKLGGKGIGRFSLFRIAEDITVTTVNKGIGHSFNLNKKQLEEDLARNTVSIFQEENHGMKTGTKIVLKSIDKYFHIREIERELENLVQLGKPQIHNIIYPNNYKKTDYIKPNRVTASAPFYVEASLNKEEISYSFSCTINEEEIYTNSTIENRFLNSLNENLADLPPIDLGEIKIYIHNFYFKPKFKKFCEINENYIKKKFLDAYQGISIYRDHYKIFGHGRNDWLKIAELRVSRSSDHIDNKQSFGYVVLDSEASLDLKEKTNREGFITSPLQIYLEEIVLCIVKQMGQDRLKSIKLLDEYILEQKQNKSSDPKEPDPKVSDPKEPDPKVSDPKEPDPKVSDPKEPDPKAPDPKVPDPKVPDPKVPDPKVSDPKIKGNSNLNSKTIIDISYEIPASAPEKIKTIVQELKYITNKHTNAQALSLRCLIDISTQFFQIRHGLEHSTNLFGNIKSVLNIMRNEKLLDQKHMQRVQAHLKDVQTVNFFNGVAHEYNFRPNYRDIKEIWNIFEGYITACVKK